MSGDVVHFTWFRAAPVAPDEGIVVRSLGHVRYHPPTACVRPRGWHVDVLVLTLAGRAHADVAGERSTALAGSLWFHPKDRPYRFEIDARVGFWEGRWIEVDGAWLRPLMARLGLAGATHVPACAVAAPIVDELFERFRVDAAAAERDAGALVWRTLAVAGAARARVRDRVDPSALAVERARRHVGQHLARALTLAELAEVAGLSPFHFARLFRARTGVAPIAYVRAARIARAQELLVAGVGIKRVAREVGYASAAHLSAAFARAVGCPPGEFRARIAGAMPP